MQLMRDHPNDSPEEIGARFARMQQRSDLASSGDGQVLDVAPGEAVEAAPGGDARALGGEATVVEAVVRGHTPAADEIALRAGVERHNIRTGGDVDAPPAA